MSLTHTHTTFARLSYIGTRTPMAQFCRVLAKRKRAQLKNPEVASTLQNSLTIKISLVGCERVWRRFRVPAATSLSVLHDQVCRLGPIGFVRTHVSFPWTQSVWVFILGTFSL